MKKIEEIDVKDVSPNTICLSDDFDMVFTLGNWMETFKGMDTYPKLFTGVAKDQSIDRSFIVEQVFDAIEENSGYDGQSNNAMIDMDMNVVDEFVSAVNRAFERNPCYDWDKAITGITPDFVKNFNAAKHLHGTGHTISERPRDLETKL